jgi:hypothetical protein
MSGLCLAATVSSFGGAEQIQLRESPLPQPAHGEIVVRAERPRKHTAMLSCTNRGGPSCCPT